MNPSPITFPVSRIEQTADGSHSIFSEKFQALYHSKHGAIQESMHVFIESGYRHLDRSSLNILEMGFGTGLNALLTLIECENKNQRVNYQTIEAYPIKAEVASKLNYLPELGRNDLMDDFARMHSCASGETLIKDNFNFTKWIQLIEKFQSDVKFDLVYYDAFAPLTQEELWTTEIFSHIASMLSDKAILVSYCSKGTFKRALMQAGFSIEKIPGPPGKREMIRATFRT